MKNIKNSTSLWLIRFYVIVLGVIVVGDFLEDGAKNLIVALLVLLALVQSFFVGRKKS